MTLEVCQPLKRSLFDSLMYIMINRVCSVWLLLTSDKVISLSGILASVNQNFKNSYFCKTGQISNLVARGQINKLHICKKISHILRVYKNKINKTERQRYG